jgi:5S rRNA maturation endonuclease (ribonuclease M5)
VIARTRVLDALTDRGCKGRGTSYQCPSHEDRAPSLSVAQRRDGQGVVLNCHAGCTAEEVVTALGLTMGDLFDEPKQKQERPRVVAEYPYIDEHGTLLLTVKRLEPGYDGQRKTFRQYAPDGRPKVAGIRRVLYRLPEVIAEAQAGGTVFVVEGEKDADNLVAAGACATCNIGGAGKWRDDYTTALRGAREVVIITDRDEPGLRHARQVAASVHAAGIPVRILEPARGKDISDHLAAGLGFDELRAPAAEEEPPPADETAPEPEPEHERPRQLVLTPASKIRIRPVRWLWDTTPEGAPPTSHGRIPLNSLAIAAGGPGLGKSQYAVWMTAAITRGLLPGELYDKPRSVIYAATEDSWAYTIAPRLIAAGADMDRVYRVDVQDDEEPSARLTLPKDISLMGKTAEAYGVGLLVADPLLSLIDASINDYRAAEVRAALEPLVAAADRHGFTVLGLAHFTKQGAADPLSRVAGSGAFGQLIRCLIAFAREEGQEGEDDTFVMSLEKNNLGRLGLPSFQYAIAPVTVDTPEGPSYVSRFVLGGETTTSVREVMQNETMPGDREATSDAVAWLQGFLTDLGGSEQAREIKKAARKEGISDSAVDRAKRKLGIKSKQSGFGRDKGARWYLPEAWEADADAA